MVKLIQQLWMIRLLEELVDAVMTIHEIGLFQNHPLILLILLINGEDFAPRCKTKGKGA